MFFVISALSFAMSDASNLKIGLNVCGSNSTFLTMSCTINCASSFFNVLPLALALLTNISATSSITLLDGAYSFIAVSYTHLTLPTILLV